MNLQISFTTTLVAMTIFACGGFLPTSEITAQEQGSQSQFETIEQAFGGLDSDSFSVRQAAGKFLEEAGPSAVSIVVNGWLNTNDNSLERKTRCETIINGWLASDRSDVKVLLCQAFMLHPDRPNADGKKWFGHPRFTRNFLDQTIRRHFQGTGINPSWDYCTISRDWIESEEDMALVAAMPALKSLRFDGPVSAERLAQLKDATKLERITLVGEPSKPALLDAGQVLELSRIESLTTLLLTNTRLDPAAVPILADFPRLSSLTYQLERADDLAHVATIDTLTDLSLSPNSNVVVNLNATDLEPLTKTNLKRLSFGACQLSDDAFPTIARIPSLNALGFRFHNLDGVREVLKNKQIKSIGISGAGIDSDRLAKLLATATHLENVSLPWSAVTDSGVSSLTSMTFLNRLSLTTNVASKSALDRLKEKLPESTKLTIDSFGNPTPQQSKLLGELYEKGAWVHSVFGNTKFLYVRTNRWTGTDADVERAVNGLDWTRLVIDLPLTPKLVDILERSAETHGKYISIRVDGQHPQELLDRLSESGKFQFAEDRHGNRLTFDPR